MKKFLSMLIAAALVLCVAGAMAETVYFVEESTDFDISMPLPEGAVVTSRSGDGNLSIVEIACEGLAPVRINIAPSEIFETASMNDLTEEEVAELAELAGMQYDNPEIKYEITELGNKFIHVCANSEFDVDSIFTLYKGYFIEMTQWHDDYAALEEDDYAFMRQLLYNIVFTPLGE